MGAALLLAIALAAPLGEVVARVGASEVTAEELRGYLATLPADDRAAAAKDPALLENAVRGYLARRAVLDAALARRFDEVPATKAQLERVREGAIVELYLQSVCEPPASYPSDAELQGAYDAALKAGALAVPRQYRLAQIFVAAKEEKATALIDEIERELKQPGADFAAVARRKTQEQGAAERGGEIGWIGETQIIPGIRAAVTALEPGHVSAPVRLEDGWHILKLLELRAPRTLSLAEAKPALAARLRAERAQANRQAYLSKLLEENPPSIDSAALTKALGPPK